MNNFEKEKQRLNDLQVPANLEQRLTHALKKQPNKRRYLPILASTIAALAFLMIAFNLNTFAYFGKKLFGYEELMSDTLSKLNNEGYGQAIGKSITLKDGTVVTIDGILSESHRFIVYYKAKNEQKNLEHLFQFGAVTGFLTNEHFSSSTHEISADGHELTGIASFNAVNPFAKKLTISIFDEVNNENNITFNYNANDAIGTTLKRKINTNIETDIGTIQVKKLTSTNASTLIVGKYTKEIDRNLNIPLNFILYADDVALPIQQGGMKSSLLGGYEFELLFDTIPQNTKQLTLKLEQFYSYEVINDTFSLNENNIHTVNSKKLRLISVTQNDGETKVRIGSDHDVVFNDVALVTKEQTVPLITTSHFEQGENEFIRTLIFETSKQPRSLSIGGMYFLEDQNINIDIPL